MSKKVDEFSILLMLDSDEFHPSSYHSIFGPNEPAVAI